MSLLAVADNSIVCSVSLINVELCIMVVFSKKIRSSVSSSSISKNSYEISLLLIVAG